MINLSRLQTEIDAALGLGYWTSLNPTPLKSGPLFLRVQRPDGEVGLDWPEPPTIEQQQLATQVILAHDGTPTFKEKLLALSHEGDHIAAMEYCLAQLIEAGLLPKQKDWVRDALTNCKMLTDEKIVPAPPDTPPAPGSIEARREAFKLLLQTAPPLTNSQVIEGFKILFGIKT